MTKTMRPTIRRLSGSLCVSSASETMFADMLRFYNENQGALYSTTA